MRIKLARNSNAGTVVFLVLVVMIVFIAVVAGIVYMMIKAIHQIKTPPPDEPGGWQQPPPLASWYEGGIVDAYVGAPSVVISSMPPPPTNFIIEAIIIYAGSDLGSMTNLVVGPIPFSSLDNYLKNGIPMETWPDGQKPPQRFYNYVVTGHNGVIKQ